MEETNDLESKLMINELVKVRLPGNKNPGNYYSRVEDALKRMMLITWPKDNGAPLPINPNQVLGFSLVHKGDAYSFNGLVDRIAQEPTPSVTIIISSAIKRIQRRQDYRVKCLIPLEVVATLSETSSGLHKAKLHLKTNTYDLSASGVSLRTSTAVKAGTLPVVKLSLPDGGPPMKVSCRVVHCFAAPENQNKFHVGIQFLKLEEDNRARLVRFVYRAQSKRAR